MLCGKEEIEPSFFIKNNGLITETVFSIVKGFGTKKGTTSNLSFFEKGAC